MANPDLRDVVSSRGGTYWTFTDSTADIALNLTFDTDDEWLSGQSASVRVFADELLPEVDASGITTAGTWVGGIILGAILTTIGGSKIEWDGDGTFTVETSLNGTTWTPAVNYREVAGLSAGTASTNKALQVRVKFLAGEPEDTITKVRSLSIKLYRNRNSAGSDSTRPASFTGNISLATDLHQPIEEHDETGVHLYNGYATIPGGNSKTEEMWMMIDTTPASGGKLFTEGAADVLVWNGSAWTGRVGTTYYVNGVATSPGSIAFVPNYWYHVVTTRPAADNGEIKIGSVNSPARVGMFATYPTELSASEVSDLYHSYLGTSILHIDETSAIDVEDAAETVKAYSYDWSLAGSG